MEIKFKAITQNAKLTKEAFSAFIDKCSGKYIKVAKYDYKEPCKKIFDGASIEEVYNTFENYGGVILKGKDKFWISVSQSYYDGIITWSGGITIKNVKKTEELLAEITALLGSLAQGDQFLFGYIATRADHDAKHLVITRFESGGGSTGWEGASNRAFFDQFPGIYWATFFGKAMYGHIGKDKFLNIPEVNYLELNDDVIGFTLNLPIDDENENSTAKRNSEKEAAHHIGKEFFFDITDKSYQPSYPAPLKAFLAGLKK
jgi:hypothetical protein